MLFRNEMTELMSSLYLTHSLEVELDRDGARGNSLSDKVKSYEAKAKKQFDRRDLYDEYLDEEDFEDYESYKSYAYRAHKRELLGGRYNSLRWVAHERNQLMHQSAYLVSEFTKFKYTLKSAIEYLKGSTFAFNSYVVTLFKMIPYLIILGFWAYFIAKMDIEKWWLIAIIGAVTFGIALQVGEILENIMKMFYSLYGAVQVLATRYTILFSALLFSYLFWGQDISYIEVLIHRLKEVL